MWRPLDIMPCGPRQNPGTPGRRRQDANTRTQDPRTIGDPPFFALLGTVTLGKLLREMLVRRKTRHASRTPTRLTRDCALSSPICKTGVISRHPRGRGRGALLNLTWKVRLEDETQEGKGGVEKGGIGSIRGAVLYRGLRFLVTICCAIV